MIARNAWSMLNGICCVYKPADVSCNRVRQAIGHKICSDLNNMDCRPPTKYVSIEGDYSKQLVVNEKSNLADDPLVVGPRYQPKDIRCTWSTYLGFNTSGLLLLGIQDGTKVAGKIRTNRLMRAYRLKGRFGRATDNCYKDGKVIEKTTFKFIRIDHIEKLLASIQSAHQKKMFELCGVDMQSQTAYELATSGPIRPSNSEIPLIYGIKCIHLEHPDFTLEIHCVNEYEMYLKSLIHEIGMKLRSSACCTGIQCIRHSYFNLENALLQKHWNLENILTNMQECNETIRNHQDIVKETSIALHQ